MLPNTAPMTLVSIHQITTPKGEMNSYVIKFRLRAELDHLTNAESVRVLTSHQLELRGIAVKHSYHDAGAACVDTALVFEVRTPLKGEEVQLVSATHAGCMSIACSVDSSRGISIAKAEIEAWAMLDEQSVVAEWYCGRQEIFAAALAKVQRTGINGIVPAHVYEISRAVRLVHTKIAHLRRCFKLPA